MTQCAEPLIWPLSRRGREMITWEVAGLPSGALVAIRLEGSADWRTMTVSADRATLAVWAAGPSFADPGDALVVSATSHAEIRVVADQMTVFLDGGFIQLLP